MWILAVIDESRLTNEKRAELTKLFEKYGFQKVVVESYSNNRIEEVTRFPDNIYAAEVQEFPNTTEIRVELQKAKIYEPIHFFYSEHADTETLVRKLRNV